MPDEISGVVELFGEPFENATVELFEEVSEQEDPTDTAIKFTDSNGEYVFTRHPNAEEGVAKDWHVAVRAVDGPQYFAYSKPGIRNGRTLLVGGSETHTVSSDSVETYEETTLEDGATLTIEEGATLNTDSGVVLEPSILRVDDGETYTVSGGSTEEWEEIQQSDGGTLTLEDGATLNTTPDVEL